MKAIDICNLLGGTLVGNPETLITKPAKIEEGEAGAISFFANPRYERYLYECRSSVLLLPAGFEPKQPLLAETLIFVRDVYAALSVLLARFGESQQPQPAAQISPQAFVHPTAQIGQNVQIEPFAYIGEGAIIGDEVVIFPQVFVGSRAQIGAQTVLHSGVKVYHGCQLGRRCIVHANAVIGSDGFGFAPQADGSFQKIPQLGNVEIGDEVEIGANTAIDRATMGSTRLESGVKLDNLIQIAHNVRVGSNTVIAAQAGIAGSAQIGQNCMIGGQAGIVGHLSIADGTKIQAQSGVDRAIRQPNTAVYGSPALAYNDYLRAYVWFKKLPQLAARLDALEKNTQPTHKPEK